jgi:hypothetical protein
LDKAVFFAHWRSQGLRNVGKLPRAPNWQPGSGVLYRVPNFRNSWPTDADTLSFLSWTLVTSDLFPKDIVKKFKYLSLQSGDKPRLSLYLLEYSDKRVVTKCRLVPTTQDVLEYPSITEWLTASILSVSKPAIGICLDMNDETEDNEDNSDDDQVSTISTPQGPPLESSRRRPSRISSIRNVEAENDDIGDSDQVISPPRPPPATTPPSTSLPDEFDGNYTPTPPSSPLVWWDKRDFIAEVAGRRFKVLEADLSLNESFSSGEIEFPFKKKETGHLTLHRLSQEAGRTAIETHHHLKYFPDADGSLETAEFWLRLTDVDDVDYLIPYFNFSDSQWPESHQRIIDRVMFTQALAAAMWKEFAGDVIELQNDVRFCPSASDS